MIAIKYGFEFPLPKIIKDYDKKLTKAEAQYFGMDTSDWEDTAYSGLFLTGPQKDIMKNFIELDYLEIQNQFKEKFFDLYHEKVKI